MDFKKIMPAYMDGLFNNKMQNLLSQKEIQLCLCSTVASGATHLHAQLNAEGFSPDWDSGGLFSARHRTAYIADQGWEFGKPTIFPDYEKRLTAAHEIGGHGLDYCLGFPSCASVFFDAMQHDLRYYYPYHQDSDEDKKVILGDFFDPVKAHGELWATLMEFALTGTYQRSSAHYFPSAIDVFNWQVADFMLPMLSVVQFRSDLKYCGKTYYDIDQWALSRDHDPFKLPMAARPLGRTNSKLTSYDKA